MERARTALAQRDADRALQHYSQARVWAVQSVTGDLWFARNLASHATRSKEDARYLSPALEAARRATATAEDPQNAWQTVAFLLAAKGDIPGAVDAYRRCLIIAPRWRQPKEMIARLQQLQTR